VTFCVWSKPLNYFLDALTAHNPLRGVCPQHHRQHWELRYIQEEELKIKKLHTSNGAAPEATKQDSMQIL